MPVFGDNLMEMMNNGGKYPMAIEDLSDDEKVVSAARVEDSSEENS